MSAFAKGVFFSMLCLSVSNIITYDLLGLELPSWLGMSTQSPSGYHGDVRDTARLVASWRAMDSNRENSAYFHYDPMAEVLAGEDIMSTAKKEASSLFRPHAPNELHPVTLRHILIDERISAHCGGEDPSIRQVVVIGAGMDTRAYRLALPAVAWFEVDMPEVIALKESILSTLPNESGISTVRNISRIPLRLDKNLNDLSSTLELNGHDPKLSTLYVMEGLLMYLQPFTISSLLKELPKAPNSLLLASQVSFKIHYLLTNALVSYLLDNFSLSSSHKVAKLFKSNMLSVKSYGCFHSWKLHLEKNIGLEMKETRGLIQWQPDVAVLPDLVSTPESVLEMSFNQVQLNYK